MADTEKEVYGRCMDDCLYPVYTKEQAQELVDDAENRANAKTQAITVFPVTITETISGTSSTFACDMTLVEIYEKSGIPQVQYMQYYGGGNLIFVCYASLVNKGDGKLVFASNPDQNGIVYFFTIDADGATCSTFTAMKYFQPTPVINESLDHHIPNGFAVRTYSQQKPLVLTGTVSYTERTVTLDGTVAAAEVETAIEQGRDVKMLLTFADEGMTAVSVSVPLVAVKQSILDFEAIADVSEIAAGNICVISIPVGRANLSAYAANFKKIAFES